MEKICFATSKEELYNLILENNAFEFLQKMFSMEITHFYKKSISLPHCIFQHEFMPFICSSDLILTNQRRTNWLFSWPS